jgi:hypothetical protein
MSKTRDTGYLNNIIQYSSTGVSFVSGSTTLLSVSSSGALTTTGTITAQTLVVQTVTSSVSAITGSTKFGQLSSNTHQFTGSMLVTGSIGINNASPSYNLDVTGTGRFTGALRTSSTFTSGDTIQLGLNSTDGGYWTWGASNSYLVAATGKALNLNPNGVSGNTGIVIATSGNVGIGTSSPGSLLGLEKAKAGSGVESLDTLSIRITGTTAVGDALNVKFLNGTNVNIATISALLGADNVAYGTLTFSTRNYNTDSLVEVMRLSNRGNLLIGATRDVGQKLRIYQPTTSEWNAKLIQPNGSSQLFVEFLTTTDGDATNTARGSIRYDGTNVLYLGTSDYRLKEDLKDYNGLNIISQLKTYDFKWKEAGSRDYGMMAHELQEVLPNYVTGVKNDINEDGSINPQQVDYAKLTPILIKAIQELKAENDTLKEILQRNNIQ